MFYDVKFGRKKEAVGKDADANGHTTDKAVPNGNSFSATSNGNGHVKNTSELAIYEQYRSQVVCVCIYEVKMVMYLLNT